MGHVRLSFMLVVLVDLARAYSDINGSSKSDLGHAEVLHEYKRSTEMTEGPKSIEVAVVQSLLLVDNVFAIPVRLTTLHINSLITIRYVETTVFASFTNLGTEQQNTTFRVDMAPESVISNFVIMDGNHIYQGEVVGEKAATKLFKSARKDGIITGQVQELENSLQFTVYVVVAASSTVNFTLTYEEFLRREDGMYSYNLNIAPEQVVEDFEAKVVITEPQGLQFVNAEWKSDPNYFLPVNITLINIVGMTQAQVLFSPNADQQRAVGQEKGLSGILMIHYEVIRRSGVGEMQVFHDYFTYFLSFDDAEEVPKQVVVVIDTSCSMNGTKLDSTKSAVNLILRSLNHTDSFNILTFSNSVQQWSIRSRPPTTLNLQNAAEFLERLKVTVSGGANIHKALVEAATQITYTEMSSNVILFLTDSAPNYGETQNDVIVSEVTQLIGQKSTPFFVSIGDDADTLLLRSLAKTNGGIHQHIKDNQNIEQKIVKFFNQVTMSVLTDIRVKVRPPAAVQRSSLTKTEYSRHFRGKEIAIAGKLSNNFKAGLLTVGITAKSEAGVVRSSKRYDIVQMPWVTNVIENATERIWAYLTVKQLSEQEPLADNTEGKKILTELQKVSLKYQLFVPSSAVLFQTVDSGQAIYFKRISRTLRERDIGNADRLCPRMCSACGDPHFIINTPDTDDPVCFTINPNKSAIINLISDPFQDILVNGEMFPFYFNGSNANKTGTIVTHNMFARLGLRLNHHKIDVSKDGISVDSELVHSWREKTVISLNRFNITIHDTTNMYVTRGNDIAMSIQRHNWKHHGAHFDFYIGNGEGFSSNVHGIIGQFQGKLIEIVNGSLHSTIGRESALMKIGNKEEHVILQTNFSSHGYRCWWAKEEFFVEGDLSDYIVPGIFDFIKDDFF